MNEFRFIRSNEVEPEIDIEPDPQFFTFELRDRLLEQLAVQIEADRHDVAALCCTENAARPPNLQVSHGNAETGTQRAVLFDRVDPFARGANCHHLTRKKEISVRFVLGPPDPPAQLIEIGETKPIRTIDDDRVGVRNIESALDDRRAN